MNSPSEPHAAASLPPVATSAIWVLVGGVVAGVLAVGALAAAEYFGQSGLSVNICVVLLSLLLAGLIAGPRQRSEYGGSAAAAVAFSIQLAASFAFNLPIDVQTLVPFQVKFLAAVGFILAVMIGGAAASPWTKRSGSRSG